MWKIIKLSLQSRLELMTTCFRSMGVKTKILISEFLIFLNVVCLKIRSTRFILLFCAFRCIYHLLRFRRGQVPGTDYPQVEVVER